MMFYWCTLVLLTLVPVVTGDNSGFKFKLTQKGLDLVAGKAIEKFQQLIQQMDFPDLTYCVFILKKYSVTGLKIHIGTLYSGQKFVQQTGVSIKMESANIRVSGNLVSGQSNSPLNLIVDTLAITATVAVKRDETGHLKLSRENCKAETGTFKADPTGSKLVDLIAWFIEQFPSIVGNRICSMMTTTIADFNPQLNAKVLEFTGMDFSMEPAVISSDSIELSFVSLNGRKKRRHLDETEDSPEN